VPLNKKCLKCSTSAVKKSIRHGGSRRYKVTYPAGEFLDFIRRGGLIFFVTFLHQGKKVKDRYSVQVFKPI
jgi:hypothetical protein